MPAKNKSNAYPKLVESFGHKALQLLRAQGERGKIFFISIAENLRFLRAEN